MACWVLRWRSFRQPSDNQNCAYNCKKRASGKPSRLAARRLPPRSRIHAVPRHSRIAGASVRCERPAMKVRDVVRMLQADGWLHVRTRGSHRQFKHSTKDGRVTVPGKANDDLAAGTLNSILKQAGLKRR